MSNVTVIGSSGFRMVCEIKNESTCKSCGKRIIWGVNGAGKWCPIDPWVEGDDAIIHFASCPFADSHRHPAGVKGPPPSPVSSNNGQAQRARVEAEIRKRLDGARQAGYEAGHLDGYNAAMATHRVRFPKDIWVRAVRLLHPDKHRAEDQQDANEVTVWLIANRPK